MKACSPKGAAAFLEAAKDDRFGIVLTFPPATGMRVNECPALQWRDIDLRKGTATVRRAVVWRPKGAGWAFAEPKTSESRRAVLCRRRPSGVSLSTGASKPNGA